jgi:hypothetical protein
MAITPVHSSNDANAQATQQAKPNTLIQQTAAKVSTAQTKTQAPQQPLATQQTQAPKPVVNGQGQKTGQIINATA